MFLPLTGNSRIAIEKGRNEVGFVPIDLGAGLLARVVAKQRLGYFWVNLRGKCLAQHGGNDCHVKKLQPSAQAGQRIGELLVEFSQRDQVQVAR